MEILSAAEVVHACNGRACNTDYTISVNGISTDSRNIKKGELFIPLKGERFDGHDYIMQAYDNGAGLVLTEKDINVGEKPYIIVDNTLEALQKISGYYKSKFNVKIVAVTGSSGKTTTKDMIAAVLSRKYNVLKTQGNLNNEIGLPLTLLNLSSSHEAAVLEMGMSGLGEIKRLADIARPEIGVISNVGTAHIEKLGSRENILIAKTEIFTYFNSSSIGIINGDNDLLKTIADVDFKLIRFGLEEHNDIRAANLSDDGASGICFDVLTGNSACAMKVPIPGVHNVYNALSAVCVGLELGMSIEDIRQGLLDFKPSKLRMEIFDTPKGIKVINDVYNANPDSMRAAVNTLTSFRQKGRIICILGDMLELGEMSEELHIELGEYIKDTGIDFLITVGNLGERISYGARNAGLKGDKIRCFSTNEEAIENLGLLLKSGDTVLIKGSRGMKMESIVEFLRERG
ncbi:MAG: UDP-N-acetylmuramoyl-tripeptide--D-alanyl-D-alanine ligase [Bacillota bacterium]